MSNKLGKGVYVRPEHRGHRSAKLSPSVNVSVWNEVMNRIDPKHYYGDMRHLAWWTVPLNKIALIHYYNNSDKYHHKFTLINDTEIHVVREGYNDEDVRFFTFYTGTSDPDYSNQHMSLELTLEQAQALVIGFSTREGFLCTKCKDPECLVPSFKHITTTCVKNLEDAEAVDALWAMMNGFNDDLRQLKCTMSTKTGRIEAQVDQNNLYAGPICFNKSYGFKNTATKTVFKQDVNNNAAISVPVGTKRKAEEMEDEQDQNNNIPISVLVGTKRKGVDIDDNYFSGIDLNEQQEKAEIESEKQEEKAKNVKPKTPREFWLRLKVDKKMKDFTVNFNKDDAKSVEGEPGTPKSVNKESATPPLQIDESSRDSYNQVQYENAKIAEFEKELAENASKNKEHPISAEMATTLDLLDEMVNTAKKETPNSQDGKSGNKKIKTSNDSDDEDFANRATEVD